jgi:HSP20 family protein
MNIIPYGYPFRTFKALTSLYRPVSIMDEIDEIAREFSRRVGFDGGTLLPHTDIYEEKYELVVKTELPGISEKELEVTLEGDVLTIKAEKKDEVTEDTTQHTRERYYGRYVRSIYLPAKVNSEKVSASLENGVLELRLPRAEEVKAKRIKVRPQLPQSERKKRQKASK